MKHLHQIIATISPNAPLGTAWNKDAALEFDDLHQAILKDTCLAQFDYTKRCYITTDFSVLGFGYCLSQPADDDTSLAAIQQENDGGDCNFLQDDFPFCLQPVAFGSQKTRGHEDKLHLYLGEGFAGDWAMNCVCHYVWGAWYTWITDSYGIRFILSYDRNNPVVLLHPPGFSLCHSVH